MNDIKPGSVIQLSEDERECLSSINQKRETAFIAFLLATEAYKRSEEEVIKFIREVRPELENFDFSINYESGKVKVLHNTMK